MIGYGEIYNLRLNRWGETYQERVQNEREHLFDLLLAKSLYRIDFEWQGQIYPASFERYKQDETETLHYLLTQVSVNIPDGTILQLPDKDGNVRPWMVWYLERIKASGYNRYIMLRMTHYITWRAMDKSEQSSWAYMYGQENNMLKDELRSRSRIDTLYNENLKASFFILPRNQYLKKDCYIIIGDKPYQEYYRVTGYDIQSSPGVEYCTVDPVYEYDLTPAPEQSSTDNPDEFYWLDFNESNPLR